MDIEFKINSQQVDFEDFPVCAAKITRRSSAADELSISLAPHAAVVPQIGDTIEVFYRGVRKFAGRTAKIPLTKSAERSVVEIVAKNAWLDLEETVYQQKWVRSINGNPASVFRSRVTLGQDLEGEKISVAQQLEEILQYAISCGAQLSVGSIDTDSEMLLDETRDISCSQAIARVLKWVPNSSVYFDYSTGGLPALNIKKRASLETETIDISRGSVSAATVTARPDLAIEGVSIKYEQENKQNDTTWLAISEEKYPPDIVSDARKTIVMTVDLDGSRSRSSTYKIVCETIRPDSVHWWREHVPALADETQIEILEYQRDNPKYSRELISGSIVSGMNFEVVPDHVRAKIRYEKPNGVIVTKDVATAVKTTNAFTGTFTIWKTSQLAEKRPEGIAKAIYEAASSMQYEGSVSLVGELSADRFGKKIRLSGSKYPEWNSIDATVVYSEENLIDQTTLLKFGPPKHLYPDNIEELFRISRNRVVTNDSSTRKTGKLPSDEDEDMSQTKAEINGNEGDSYYERFIVSENPSLSEVRNIDLNVADLEGNEAAKMREIYLCYNGYLATAKVLMTNPVIEQ